MLIKTASIELKRTHPKFNIKILHPGTVDTNLSKPFAKNSNYKIMSPNESTEKMIKVLFSDSEGLFLILMERNKILDFNILSKKLRLIPIVR